MKQAVILFLFCITCCSPKSDILRTYKSASPFITSNRDGSFHIFSECNVYIKPVTQKDWKKLLSFKPYTNKVKQFHYRIPALHFFMVIIENRERMPVKLKDIIVSYGAEKKSKITNSDINKKYNLPNYRMVNYKEMFKFRKLRKNFEISTFDKIELPDLVPLHLPFVPAYDKVFRVIAFEWIPVQYRAIKISFILNYSKKEKVIDFNLTRYEYRPEK